MKKHPESIYKKIDEILKEDPGGGSYCSSVVVEGSKVEYCCSFATGMASIFWLGQYAKKFKVRLPLKYSNHQPLHVSRICRLAIEENIPLK